jgi:hypothetical protein
MKLFDIDWADFIARLADWDRLSLRARKAFVELKSNQGMEVREFDGYAADLVAAGLLSYYADGRRVKLCKECYPFARAIRAMARHDVFGSPSAEIHYAYLCDHFTARQRAALTPRSHRYGYGYGDETYLLRQTRSVAWLERILVAENGSHWERSGVFGKPLLDQPRVFQAVRHIVGQFKTFDGPVALRDLPDRFAALSGEVLGRAILAGIRYLFLFPAMRPDDMTPVIGLWPTVTRRLHRPKLSQPKRVQPDETYHSALLVDDITAILVAAAARPLRIRANDGALFAKVEEEIVSNLASTPDWIAGLNSCSPSARVDAALRLLRALEYVGKAGKAGKDLSLQTTDRGADWLAASAKNRLMTVLDRLNPDKSKAVKKGRSPTADTFDDLVPEFIDEYDLYDAPCPFNLIPTSISVTGSRDWNPLAELAKAFDTLRGDGFVLVEEFLNWHSQEFNPLLRLRTDGRPLEVRIGWSRHEPTDEETEALWWNFLREFAETRLFPLGGLRMGVLGAQRDKCISLTDTGRYLLGLIENFDYGPEHEGENPVLVQPSFDVVFTSPSPQAEASIGRFAQRKGQRVGTLFKITKPSILAAACTGMTAQQVLDTLHDASAKEVPANVKREIQGWFDQCRRVTVREAILVHCPDAQTAARVLAAGGKKATAITDTVIELAGSKSDATLFRRLDAMGIFAGQAKASANRPVECGAVKGASGP